MELCLLVCGYYVTTRKIRQVRNTQHLDGIKAISLQVAPHSAGTEQRLTPQSSWFCVGTSAPGILKANLTPVMSMNVEIKHEKHLSHYF